jgi:2-polyprenyl-3-methyl-5-hydroxy-6-metoxy-1,4-benzoquinol methylase
MQPDTSQIDNQRDYYNARWSEFSFADGLDLTRLLAVLKIVESLKFTSPPAICDLGCGAGWAVGVLGCFGPTVGVDLSDTTTAAEQFPRSRFISANVLDWSHPHNTFDIITSVEVIEHIEPPLQQRYIQVAHDLLKPGGHFILTTPNARTMKAFPRGGREYTNQPVEAWLSRGELRNLLSSHFEVLSLKSIVGGFGTRNSYRVMNSAKLQTLFGFMGMRHAWQSLGLRLDYGLHLVAHATKPVSNASR